MNLQNAEILGMSLLVIATLLSIYALLLKIRESSKESPDPKLTYATRKDMSFMRIELKEHNQQHKDDFRNLQRELKEEHKMLDQLLRVNSSQVSALIAQQEITQQRLYELSIKTDKTLKKLRS